MNGMSIMKIILTNTKMMTAKFGKATALIGSYAVIVVVMVKVALVLPINTNILTRTKRMKD